MAAEPPRPRPAPAPAPAPAPEPAPAAAHPGAVAWRFPIPIPGQESAPALRNGVVVSSQGHIIAAIGRRVVALRDQGNAAKAAWEFKTGAHIPGPPVLGGDGRIRVHSGDGFLYCLSEAGEALWPPVSVGEPLGWAAPVVDDQNNTYICSYTGGLLRVDPRGALKPTPFFRSRQKLDSTALIRRGVLYVGGEDAFVYALNIEGDRAKPVWDQLQDHGKTEWFINSSPVPGPDGSIVVAGRDEYLYAFHEDGSLFWKLQIRGQMLASPVVDTNGNIFVGIALVKRGVEDRGKIVCVNARTRRVDWEFATQGPVESTPVLGDDGMVYVGDNRGIVYALDKNGQKQWTANVGSAVRSSGNIVAPNRLIYGLDNGSLCCVACSSGSLAAGWPKYMGP